MHEAQHGVDARAAGHDPQTASEERATEHNAYTNATSLSCKLLGMAVPQDLLTRYLPRFC
jgi:hypothetical protein